MHKSADFGPNGFLQPALKEQSIKYLLFNLKGEVVRWFVDYKMGDVYSYGPCLF